MKLPLSRYAFLGFVLLSANLHASVTIDGPSTDWTPVHYDGVQSDFFNDQQSGQNDIDIVGSAPESLINDPAIQFQFSYGALPDSSDAMLAFRIRMGGPNGKKDYFTGHAWIGFDLDANNSVDVFIGASGDKDNYSIGIYDAGTDTNLGPSTTSIVVPALQTFSGSLVGATDWSWDAVVNIDTTAINTDLDGEDPDHFLSFSFSYAAFVTQVSGLGYSYDINTPVGIVAATSISEQSLNGDINGINGDSIADWEIGDPLAVPEPETYALWLAIVALGYCILRRPA